MSTQVIDGVFYVVVLIMSIVVHEFAHGYAAYKLGDNTANMSGRLTLNPLKHLDPFGSIILPLFLVLTHVGFVIGWARPVPYNPDNLRNKRWGSLAVAIAGIIANILIAGIFALAIRFVPSLVGLPAYTSDVLLMHPFYRITIMIVFLNLVLALFNLIPIPPLDGSKILFAFVPARYRYIQNFLEQWGIFFLLLFIIFIWGQVAPLIYIVFHLLTGISLVG
jgi:Zn-dependent protease